MGDMSADVHKDGQANFGDIMQRSAGEVPIPPTLARKLKDTEWYTGDPFHGVVLAANGALQRTMSAWYQAEIKVEVIFNRDIQEVVAWVQPHVKQYDRRVQMSCKDKVFCVATSRIILSDQGAVDAVESGGVGIAQLYKHFKILPHFYLVDAGQESAPTGHQLWREYVLHGGGIECRIREDFCPNFLDLFGEVSASAGFWKGGDGKGMERRSDDASTAEPNPTKAAEAAKAEPALCSTRSDAHLGDLLKGTRCINILDDELAHSAHPLQRALLTAAGNVVRVVTSYHKVSVQVGLLRSRRVPGKSNEYERVVLMFCEGIAFCRARTLVKLESQELKELVDSGSCDVGELFRAKDLLPEFSLLQVQLCPSDVPGFGRKYTLTAPGISCHIAEEFAVVALTLSRDMRPSQFAGQLPGIPHIWKDFAVML
ncbi:unnamed protein product [Symbiodinium microadriaticum]|nr:unnamed protein product [Symbiodinium microadriaticum]